MNKGYAVLFLVGVLGMLGCASQEMPEAVPEQVRLSADLAPLDGLIARSVNRAREALEDLRALRAGADPGATTLEGVPLESPPELRRLVSLPWQGPLAQGVKRLADLAGYDFSVTGARAVPVMVDIGADPQSRLMALRAMGLQAGTLATVRVDPAHRTIEVIYD